MSSQQLITAPTREPWTLAEAKAHLRISIDAEDAILRQYVKAARQWVEDETKRALVNQTWDYSLDAFPYWRIRLPLGRCQSVTQISYYDSSGAVQTLTGPSSGSPAGTDYQEDLSSDEGGILSPTPSGSWPSWQSYRMKAVTVRFVAGYGSDPTSIPADLRFAVLYRLSDLYEYRGAFDGDGTDRARNMVDSYRLGLFA